MRFADLKADQSLDCKLDATSHNKAYPKELFCTVVAMVTIENDVWEYELSIKTFTVKFVLQNKQN